MKSFELSLFLAYKRNHGHEFEFYELYSCCWQWQAHEIIIGKTASQRWRKSHVELGH